MTKKINHKKVRICLFYIAIAFFLVLFLQRENLKGLRTSVDDNNNSLHITDTSVLNSLEYKDDVLYVTGEDPYIIFTECKGYVQQIDVELEYTGKTLGAIAVYYDTGAGFNENEKNAVPFTGSGKYSLIVKEKVNSLRIDIEGDVTNFKFNSIEIATVPKEIIFNETCVTMLLYFIADLITLLTIWICTKKSIFDILKKYNRIALMMIYLGEKYLFGLGYASGATTQTKMVILGCNVFLILTILFKIEKMNKQATISFLLGVFCFYLCWTMVIPFNQAPDEEMRYLIPYYIYENGTIPRGEDPAIRNQVWGISYGFTPILTYIISAVFMKIVSVFSTTSSALLFAARLPSVLFGIGTIVLSILISRKLFSEKMEWLMPVFIAFLPQFAFVSCYVNCDAIAIFSTAWIIYGMLNAKEKMWSLKSCVLLGVGIGICLMSYYNAYGIIIVAILYNVIHVLKNKEIERKFQFIIIRIIWVAIPALIVSGWWFVRNYILYQDLLGLNTSGYYAERYALDAFKPSNRMTPNKQGVGLKYMLFDMNWIKLSWLSFIGCFGYMNVFLNNIHYYYLSIILLTGLLCMLVPKNVYKDTGTNIMNALMVLMCGITIFISVYYSYFNDFQPQGRYCMPLIIAFVYLIVSGYEKISEKKWVRALIRIGSIGYCFLSFEVLFNVVFHQYII